MTRDTGFVIYLEGATDLAILRGFAKTLKHPAEEILDSAFVHYVLNQPKLAEQHFHGLREAKPDLVAVAIFDRLEAGLPAGFVIPVKQWRRREIENYLATRDVLLRYARGMEPDDLVSMALRKTREEAMTEAIGRVEAALRESGRDPWSADSKVSDDFLPTVFKRYFEKLGTDDRLAKSNFYELADYFPANEIDSEIVEALDMIVREAAKARPTSN